MKNAIRVTFLSVCIFLLSIVCSIADDNTVVVVNELQLNESFIDKVNVSGGVRAGLMLSSSKQSVDFDQLYIYLGDKGESSAQSVLCVSMVSNDGRYSSNWEHRLEQQKTGPIKFSLKSKHKEQLAAYTPSELVVLASVAQESCQSKKQQYVPASWGFVQDGKYILFVNSGGADAAVSVSGRKERISCDKILNGKTIAYDKKCEIDQSIIGQEKKLSLHRSNFNNTLPDVKIELK